MARVDLAFAILAQQPIPADHGYALYGALSRTIPLLHSSNGIGIHPISGQQVGNRQLSLTARSRLVLRVETDVITQILPLSGRQLDVTGTKLNVGVPQVRAIKPVATLRSRLVTIKLPDLIEPGPFEDAVRRQTEALNISPDATITLGKRRTLRIKDKEVIGYEVTFAGLSPGDSLLIQEHGVGGRRHMGCGIFVPSGFREEP